MTDWEWEKRARDLAVEYDGTEAEWVSLAVRLGREMADARAEEIMKRLESECGEVHKQSGRRTDYASGLAYASEIARSFISKPKTREQVLEEALQRMIDRLDRRESCKPEWIWATAHEALDWKPD